MESILKTIKIMIGIQSDYKQFDAVIIGHINTILMTLSQLGVGPESPALITSELDTWNNVLGDTKNIEAVKTYIALKVQLLFDPPSSSYVLEAKNRQAAELEWRLNVQVD